MSVGEAVSEYLANLPYELARGTRLNYKWRLGVFVAWCEQSGVTLEILGGKRANSTITSFLSWLEESRHACKKGEGGEMMALSQSTMHGYLVLIKMFLNWCLEDEEMSEFVKAIAVKRVKLGRLDEKIVETFTDEHIRRLLIACKQEYNEHLRLRNKCIVQLFISTGIRVAELCTLTVGHTELDPESPYIKVFGKGRKEREIGLDNETRHALSTYKRKFRAKAAYGAPLFVDRSLMHGLSTYTVEHIVEKLGRVAGIGGVRCSPHTFRHSFSVRFLKNGGDILDLSRILGHKRLNITEEYIKTLSSRDIRLRRIK